MRARAVATAYRCAPPRTCRWSGFRDEDVARLPVSRVRGRALRHRRRRTHVPALPAPPSAEGGTSRPAATGAAGGGARAPDDRLRHRGTASVSQPDLSPSWRPCRRRSGPGPPGMRPTGGRGRVRGGCVTETGGGVHPRRGGARDRRGPHPVRRRHPTLRSRPPHCCAPTCSASTRRWSVPVAQFPLRAVAGGTPGEVPVTALAADAYHVSYRLEDPRA
ncbi:hypothetical protein QJS66_09140 [Kocuria rhizophila]|nr:hypothetical protein QJS66_09140 [Kocuria rhizophila]